MSVINSADNRDRMHIIHKILAKAKHQISKSRLSTAVGLRAGHHFKRYEDTLINSDLLKKVDPPPNYVTKQHIYDLQTTEKGEQAISLIRDLYQLFDITLDRE